MLIPSWHCDMSDEQEGVPLLVISRDAAQTAFQHPAIRQQLEKILAHGLFARSDRMGRFLRVAVQWTLEGKAAELKEYLLGVEVFDRKASYDPRVDPIVRVEARRLRSKLKAYYEGDGRTDAIVIEFLKGSYAPQIRARAQAPPPPEPARPVPGIVTIAVLPLVNLSADPDNEYFTDGLTEELIHALTKLPGMRVVAWTTAARMRGRQEEIGAIRQQLQVGTVLTGSVRIAGPSLRVRSQLIDTETGVYLWSETFDRQMQDVFAIQEEIARAIVRTLRVQLAGKLESALTGRGRTTVSSYDWYLKGLSATSPHAGASRTKRPLFRKWGGGSALAYAGLADAYSLLMDYGLMSPSGGVPQAKASAERAIELDPNLGEPYASLALIRGVYERDWATPVAAVDMDQIDTHATAIAAQEVAHLEPGATVELDADVTAFPTPFSQLKPGRYAVQAVLDRDHSYNYTGRGPGDLVSGVVEMDLPGDAAQRLTLATAIPKADPLQPLSNVPAALKEVYATAKADIHSIDFTSRALSRFWGRPAALRGWVVTPPDYAAHPGQRYPTVYDTQGFGGSLTPQLIS